jgi:hypothetical protein
MSNKLILTNGSSIYNSNKIYKVNEVVSYNDIVYQNKTGANSEPGVGSDWVKVIEDISGLAPLADAVFTTPIVVPDGVEADEAVNKGQLDLKANDNAVVHLSGNETISGIKTFLSGMFSLRNVANTFSSFFLNNNTASRTYTLQDKSGTIAHLDDVTTASHWTKTVNDIANNNSGNVGIGTGATAPSSKLTVFGDVDFKNTSGTSKFSFNTTTSQLNLGAGTVIASQYSGSGSGTDLLFDNSNNNYNFTIGNLSTAFTISKNALNLAKTLTVSSGSAVFNMLALSPTINQTGTSTSIFRGIYINPILTSDLVGFRAIEVTAGKSIFQEVILQKPLKLAQYTVATLPTGTQGDEAYVTDALTPTYLGVVVGGGAVVCKVFHNGTNWIT